MKRLMAVVAPALGLGAGAAAAPALAITLPSGFEVETLVASAPSAVGAEYAPDGRLFFNQGGALRVRNPNGTLATLPGVPGFAYGLAVDTNFATNGYVYMAYTQATPKHGRIDRLKITPANQQIERVSILGKVDGPCPQGPPSNTVDCIPFKDPNVHAVGTLVSDPRDGTLWVGNGDNAMPASDDAHARDALDVNGLSGKILHVDREGKGLPGHPFCPGDNDLAHNCTKVFARGMRNPFRFRLRPSDGVPVAGDVGLESYEEVDVVRAGRNYGWPCYEGNIRTPGAHQSHATCQALYADPAAQNYTAPVHTYNRTEGRSVTGGPVYAPKNGPSDFPPEYHGDYFYADYVTGFIKRLRITIADALAEPPLPFATGQKDIVSLEQGPDGSLIVVEGKFDGTGGAIYKIKHTGTSDRAPTARITADKLAGQVPLTIKFDGRSSTDPEGRPLTYSWDFDNGTALNTEPNPSHTYTNGSRNRTVTLTVRDPAGNTDVDQVTVAPGNGAPVVDIGGPTTFRGGDVINMTGSATDAEDGNLTGSSLQWDVVLFHRDHDHPEGETSHGTTRTFTATRDHEEESLYRVTLRATDSRGITTEKRVNIDPQLINLRLASEPSGVPVAIGGIARPTPFDRPSTINFITTVTAPEEHTDGTRTYRFEGWSDGGARSHDISIPASDTTLTAVYRETTVPPETGSGGDSTGGGSAGGGSAGGGMRFAMLLPRGGLQVDGKGRIALKLRCARSTGSCRLRAALVTRPRRASAERRLAASQAVSVPAGTRAAVRLKLTKAARLTLRRTRLLRALVRVTGEGQRLERRVVVRPRPPALTAGLGPPPMATFK